MQRTYISNQAKLTNKEIHAYVYSTQAINHRTTPQHKRTVQVKNLHYATITSTIIFKFQQSLHMADSDHYDG